jgi:hypothetical protein
MTVILPLIILIIIILLVTITAKKSTTIQWKYINRTGITWIIGIYVTLLVASVILFYSLPKEKFADVRTVSQEKIWAAERGYISFYDSAQKGAIHELEGVTRNGEWEFSYTDEKLQLIKGDTVTSIEVFAERKDTNDNKIEVSSYATDLMIEGVVIKDSLKPPGVELSGNNLRIIQPKITELKYAMFDKEFTISQFTSEPNKSVRYGGNAVMGNQILYLRIPKDLEVLGDIQFVNE